MKTTSPGFNILAVSIASRTRLSPNTFACDELILFTDRQAHFTGFRAHASAKNGIAVAVGWNGCAVCPGAAAQALAVYMIAAKATFWCAGWVGSVALKQSNFRAW